MAIKKTKAKKLSEPPLCIRTFSLTPDNDRVLREIAGAASDSLGWTVSRSAVLRALLSFADLHNSYAFGWISQALFPLIEKEIDTGRVWGTKT